MPRPTRRVWLGVDEAWPSLVVNPREKGWPGSWRVPDGLLQQYEGLAKEIERVEQLIVKAALDDGMPESQVRAILEYWEENGK